MVQDKNIIAMQSVIAQSRHQASSFVIEPVASQPNWVKVSNGKRARTYPLGREAPVLLSNELRHGLFD